ncbi:MAG TPA: hypothetical protein PK636_00980 [bacterium]|nr:hypothetical protein [bacterium]HPJ71240.1 hypothetical protein [bacterium]HPQ66804.1 hypothetical protein [bacterium]
MTANGQKKLLSLLVRIGIVMLLGMSVFEALKQAVAPGIDLWESHVVTIAFGTLTAIVASLFILKKQIALNESLHEKDARNIKLQRELQATIEQLQTSIATINRLTGMLPICAHCKKIRNDTGEWESMEKYISERSTAEFTHGLCPKCARELYGEFDTPEGGDRGRTQGSGKD